MSGWKTKTGSACVFLGGVLFAAVEACPVAEWQSWIKFAATILMAAGTGLGMYGIGHKVERKT
jgi:hypothetical protein